MNAHTPLPTKSAYVVPVDDVEILIHRVRRLAQIAANCIEILETGDDRDLAAFVVYEMQAASEALYTRFFASVGKGLVAEVQL